MEEGDRVVEEGDRVVEEVWKAEENSCQYTWKAGHASFTKHQRINTV